MLFYVSIHDLLSVFSELPQIDVVIPAARRRTLSCPSCRSCYLGSLVGLVGLVGLTWLTLTNNTSTITRTQFRAYFRRFWTSSPDLEKTGRWVHERNTPATPSMLCLVLCVLIMTTHTAPWFKVNKDHLLMIALFTFDCNWFVTVCCTSNVGITQHWPSLRRSLTSSPSINCLKKLARVG